MLVKDLIEQLQKLDPRLDVLCYAEDNELLKSGHGSVFFEISAVKATDGEFCRIDERPCLKFGKSELSEKVAVIEITSDF